jgi:hypothetical protein
MKYDITFREGYMTSVIMGNHPKQYVYTRKKRLVDTIQKKTQLIKSYSYLF